MKRSTVMLLSLGIVLPLLALVWSPGPSASRGLFADFEHPDVWDIAPEEGFTLARSTEHVTQGRYALKVVFPVAQWPSINTKRLRQPRKDYETLQLDVFNPQDEPVRFAVRLDDRTGKRVTVERRLQPGANTLRIPRSELARRIDPGALAFVVLFLPEVREETTLYFDNLRLDAGAAPERAREATRPPAQERAMTTTPTPRASAPEPSLTEFAPPPVPPAPREGTLDADVARLRGASGPALVSNGIPFAPGQLTSEQEVRILHAGSELSLATQVLARWPRDDSIRSLLVQFQLDMEQVVESVRLQWGVARATADVPIQEVAWEFPEAFLTLPAWWLCESQVLGAQVPMYEHDFPEYDDRLREYYPRRRDDRLTGDIRQDGYYSTPHVFYQLYVRSGDVEKFLAARREAIAFREQEILLEGPNRGRHVKYAEPRYLYVEALADDYLLTGDPRSREVAGYMAEYLQTHFDPERGYYRKADTGFWTERRHAAAFHGVLTYYEISGDPAALEYATRYLEALDRTQREWPGRGGFIHNLYAHDPEEGARPDEYGGSPFMTGLLLEPIIKYHRLTGSETALRSIVLALDWLIREGLAPDGETFRYLTSDRYRDASGPPDLNLLIVHAFGYGYRQSGFTRSEYLEIGTRLFRRGIEDAYLKKRKHFNQNYRSSGHFLAYIAAPGTPGRRGAHAAQPVGLAAGQLYASDFETTTGGWRSGSPDTRVTRSRGVAWSGEGALEVESLSGTSLMSVRNAFEGWDLLGYPTLRFAYRIPPGLSVELRAATPYGDWIVLGRTHPTETVTDDGRHALVDDGAWHELTMDVADAVRRELPGVRRVVELEVVGQRAQSGAERFWIDDMVVAQANEPAGPR